MKVNMALCDYTKWVVILLLVLLAVLVVRQCMNRKATESFSFAQEQMMASTAEQGVAGRPNWAAPLPPRSYPGLASASLLGDKFGGVNNMGALPPQPVMLNNDSMNMGVAEGFAFLGGGYGAAPEVPAGLSSQQAGAMLNQQLTGGKPEYQEAQLPLGDIHQVGMDPTDPQNFMYNRTVFAPLKRQYGNGVDFIRGDIDVKQEYRGWFDVRPATDKDIVTGYFDRYIDIQQETALKDAQWTRSTPVSTLYNAAISPAANQFVAYANV